MAESQPELNVLSKHEYDITVIISQNLSYFSLKFVESAFITRDQSSNVLDMYGVENRDKASRLLNYAYAKLGIIRSPEEREKWFWCFLLHFESKATYRELAATLRKEYRKETNSEDTRHDVRVVKDKFEDAKEVSVIQNASSGLALQGVLVSRKLNDLSSKRDVVLQPPNNVQLMGPSIDQQSKSWYFTSERHEERVTAIVDTLGYSVAELAKVGERGVSLELCGAFKSVYEEEKRGASILQENNFNSTVKYSFLPVKSFSFSDQLCLSSDALVHLKEIDEKYSSSEEEIKAQCTDFLHKFGSHVYTGPLHFGGKYRLRSSSSGFKESERRDVQKLQGEVIANQERSGSTSAPVMISTMDGDFYRKYSDALVSQTSLKVNLTGGPLVVRDYSEWVRGLEMSNSTWSLIDRGTERVPVWDVFKRKHANDFHNSSALVDIMKQAWEAMNKKSSIVDENTGKGEEQTEAIHSESAPTASAAEERNVTEKYKYVPVPKEEQTGARDSESAKKTNVTEKYVPTSVPQYLIKEKVQTGARDGEDAAKTKVTEYTLRKPWEKKPLRKGDEDDLPEDSIDAELSGVGLEPSYWSGVFEKQLGIKTPQSLQYVGGESYQLLLQYLRKPWEKKALGKLLKMESEETAYKEKREKQKEQLKKRQDESAEFLKTLKDLEKEGKDRHDKGVQEMEQGFRERLQIPESVWLREDATLSQAIEKMESMHGNISGALKNRENESDALVITTASSGLALRGVLITPDPDDATKLKECLLRAPEDVKFDGPSHFQHDKIEQFSSKKKENEFSKNVKMLGYSASASAKAGFWGIGVEASSSYSKKDEKEETKEHHTEETYNSTVKYSIMPLASFSFKDDQLHLSQDAVLHLKKIDTALGHDHLQSVDDKCEQFFHKFGSHALKGPLHFGGKYEWKSYTSGFKESEKHTVQALQSEAISASVSISYGNVAGGSASGNVSKMKGSFSGNYSEALTSQTFLEITVTGGPPEVIGLPDWKNGLVASNKTWYLIDRGAEGVSVWDIIEMNHVSDFQNTPYLVKTLKQTWQKMNKLDISPPKKDMAVDVKEVMDRVTLWNDRPDKNQFEKQLGQLVEKKDIVTKEYLDPQAWATDYLSQSPLKQFLRSVVRVCIKGEFEHSGRLKRSIRRLVEPIDLDITRVFPDHESIRQWLYGTPAINPPMVCMDFISMHKYFQLALESMHGGVYDKRMDPGSVIQPDLAIKATATVAKAVFCVRRYLHKGGQKYEDCFLTTMLYPLRYDPENNVFLVLLTRNELKYLCEEFEEESKAFFDIKEEKPLQSLQSHLFLLAVNVYDVFDVSEKCIKDHLKYLEQQIGDEMKPEISSCLVELKSQDYSNLESFKNKLQSLVQGVFVQQRGTGVLLDDILAQEVQSERSVPNEPQSLQHKNEKVERLFSLLHLSAHLSQKLTLSYALQIREDTLEKRKADVDQSKDVAAEANTEPQKNQTQNKLQCTDPLLYSDIILQKIMTFDHRCRLTLTSSSPVSDQSPPSSDSESDSESDEETIEVLVHPMDGLLALLHCSDNFLRQDLMCRLATCQLAVPLLLPDPITHEPTFLLWALRTIVKEFRIGNGTASYSGPIIGYPAPIVSFLRIGHHSKSKSHLLNTIINTTGYATFFHWNSDGHRGKHILVNGLVEVSWYLPSNNDNLFPDAISFANLHGDARAHSKQVQFLSEVSCMHFVFLNENDLNDATLEVLKNLSQAPGGIAILQSERSASNKSLQEKLLVKIPREKWSVLKLFNKSDYESKCRIQKTILAIVGQKTNLKLEQCKDLAHKCGISVDEDDPDCITGRGLANEVLTIIEKFKETNPGKSPKKLLVLQSSDLWHKWAAMDKEQYRQIRKGYMSMVEYGALQRKQMNMIRKTQQLNAQNPGPLIASFLNSLLKHKGPIAWYYLHWLKLILDNLSRELLPPLHSRYNKKRKELNDIQMQEKKDEIAEKLCRDDMNKLNIELINASFGPEHLLREMSQLYEAVISQDSAPSSLKTKISGLPEIAAQLLVDGFPLELMDGDAAHVPKDWISAVLEKVSDILKITTSNPQLFVLSVLGLQSTGKSTMLNTLFGVQFTVNAGRCTRGAFMQLLPVHCSLQKKCGFQYFLIIDTEGLRAPELDALQTQKHDNELATFVIGMAHLTIMNIKGEIAGDMDDILQTTVHAFLRMSEVKLRPSCHFVHQNVPAVAAGNKAMMGRFKIKDKLDRIAQEAAKEAGLQARYFNQVIQFDYENDVSFFPSLWTGSPPMAPVNTGYSVEAQVLKRHLINCTKKSLKSRDNSVLQLKQHLEELWKAILQENFVFSFKSTFEIAAFKTLEEHYGDWSMSFKNAMINWQHKSQIKLMSCKIEDLLTIYKDLTELPTAGKDRTESLPQYIGRIYQDLETKMTAFFDESPKQEIISKWKYDTEVRLRTLRGKLQTHAENHCKQLFSSRKIRATAEKTKEKMSVDILERVKQLALTLEKGKMNDKQLNEMFEQNWIEWITELTASIEKIEGPNVKFEVEKSMTDMLNVHQKLVMQRLSDPGTGKPLEKWGIHLKLQVRRVHLKLSQTSTWASKYKQLVGAGRSIDDFLKPAQNDTDIILKDVEVYLNKKQGSGENFNPEYTTQLLQELFSNIGNVQSHQFVFTAEYKVDMALTACGHALHVFVEMADAFRKKHDPSEYIQREMKDHCLKLFMDQYKQLVNSRKTRARVEEKEKIRVDILERVKELASTLEKGKMNDKELKEVFEQSWIEWIRELTAGTEKIEDPNVKFEVEKSMIDKLHTYHKLVMQRLSDSATGKPLEKWGIHLKLQIRHVHLKLSQPSTWGGKFKWAVAGRSIDEFLIPAQQETDIILRDVKDYLNKKQCSGENFNPEFTTKLLQELFNNIGKVQSDEFFFTAEYKVDMALTACGHALHVFVAMADAFRKKHDLSEYIQREMKDHCLKLFMDQCNQIAQEITAAGTLCQQLKKPVTHQVMYGLSLAIVRDIGGRKLWIRNKPSLKAKILLNIGEKLTQGRGSFSDCALYLKDAKQSLQYWVKLYTEQHCDEEERNKSRISILATQELRDIINTLKNKVKSVTQKFPRSEEFHLKDWLTKFHTEVTTGKGTLLLNLSELHVLGGNQVFKHLDIFTEKVVKGLDDLHSSLKAEFQTMRSSVMQILEKKPYDTVFEEVAGCTEQCPFCKEQCDHTNAEHSSSVKHSTQHRPHCLAGIRWTSTNTMVLDMCTSLVHGDTRFQNRDTNHEWHPYKKYAKLYPDWSIPDDTSDTASLYWKWLVGNYSTEIEALFGHRKTTIPDEWKALKWPRVKEWLQKEYRL